MTAEYRDVVAVGASAGGVEALRALAGGLPPDYPGAVLMVLHVPRAGPTALPAILARSGPLPAALAVDGEELRGGRIYVAPNDRHLLVVDGRLRLTRGPTENGHRPAIDPLFRSVARAYAGRVIGVVLSGARDDGAAGLAVIAAHGGTTVVQDPADALYPSMPRAAIEHARPDHIVVAAKLGDLLGQLTAEQIPGSPAQPRDRLLDAEVSMSELAPITTDEFASPAGYGCPSCGGSLFEIPGSPLPRYRCRVGHAWSPDTLLDEQAVALEGALWMALRALEDKSALSRRMADDRIGRRSSTGMRFRDIADEAESAGATIRDLIARIGSASATAERPPGPATEVR
jgi:two-component system, chemotaxis family, protein-glutamate methylesterase/glutaminase